MQPEITPKPSHGIPAKFIIGIVCLVAAVIYLIATSTQANAQYFMTVDEVLARKSELSGKTIRLSGVVLGETIKFDPVSQNLTFAIVQITGNTAELEKEGGLGAAVHAAVTDPGRNRMAVVYKGPRPDLLKNEAQAILTGTLAADGSFSASEILLKCPTKYEQAGPGQEGKP